MTKQANAYRILAGPENLFDENFDPAAFYADLPNYDYNTSSVQGSPQDILDLFFTFQRRIPSGDFTSLSPSECTKAYAQQYITNWGDLLVIQKSSPFYYQIAYDYQKEPCVQDCRTMDSCCSSRGIANGMLEWDPDASIWIQSMEPNEADAVIGSQRTVYKQGYTNVTAQLDDDSLAPSLHSIGLPSQSPSYAWQCQTDRNPADSITSCNSSQSLPMPFGGPVLQCWAEKVSESCTLNFSLYLGLVVVICNFTKFVCMALTIWWHWTPSLITVGDAIQSYLDKPDQTTLGKCLYSGNQMRLLWGKESHTLGSTLQPNYFGLPHLAKFSSPTTYRCETRSWASFASIERWLACFCM